MIDCGAAVRGANVMVGAAVLLLTVKVPGLKTVVAPVLTVIGPVVAPVGTVTTSWVPVADTTVAVLPLNCTGSDEGVVENPEPDLVMVLPAAPCGEERLATASVVIGLGVVDSRLPALS